MPVRTVHVPSGYLKADMHCHTYFSGKTDHLTALEPMDCYTTPLDLYDLAKKRGMDLVTITDHNSIDGCLNLLESKPGIKDFLIGEEVTVQVPEFHTNVHIAVYDITEAQHREISYLKENFDDTIAYLRSENIIHALNHLFHGFPIQYAKGFLEKMMGSFDLFEGLNGALHDGHNHITGRISGLFPGKGLIAGSDSHTKLRLGSCFTAAKAASKKEFLNQIRNGNTIVAGRYGNFHHLFNDAMGVYLNYFRDLVFRRRIHIHWPFWKEVRNGIGWVVCLPVFFAGALGGLLVQTIVERLRQEKYEQIIEELSHGTKGNPDNPPILKREPDGAY